MGRSLLDQVLMRPAGITHQVNDLLLAFVAPQISKRECVQNKLHLEQLLALLLDVLALQRTLLSALLHAQSAELVAPKGKTRPLVGQGNGAMHDARLRCCCCMPLVRKLTK